MENKQEDIKATQQENAVNNSIQIIQPAQEEAPNTVQLVQPKAALSEIAEVERKYRETIERENK